MSLKLPKNRWTLVKSGVTNSDFIFQKTKNGGSHLYSLWWVTGGAAAPDADPTNQVNPEDGVLVSVGAGGGSQPLSEKINLTFTAAKDVYALSYYADGKVTEANAGTSKISDLTIETVSPKELNLIDGNVYNIYAEAKGGLEPYTYTMYIVGSGGGVGTSIPVVGNICTYTAAIADNNKVYYWKVTDSNSVSYTSAFFPISVIA